MLHLLAKAAAPGDPGGPGSSHQQGCPQAPGRRALTLIVLQEPVGPHVPQLHRVVHAGGRNARAAGVEVHVGDEAGETGLSRHRGLCWRHPTPPLLMLSQNPPRTVSAAGGQGERGGAVTETT